MCPISGYLQSLILIFTLLLICHAALVKCFINITFNPKNVTLYMYDSVTVEYNVASLSENVTECVLYSERPRVAFVEKDIIIKYPNQTGSFNVTGNFLGETVISCKSPASVEPATSDTLKVKCLRKPRLIDRIFTASTATLVTIIYINFGCVVQWPELKQLVKRPVGPIIGLFGHSIIMPISSYIIGYLLFPNDAAMRLGLFFTGVSPAGGASNIWTAILDGNIELSILMTTISTIGAFAFMPLWLFTLGRTIFKDAHLEVPYRHISTYVFALVVPLTIGYLINRYMKKTGAFLGRILKGFSSLLILFIIIFAIITNLYLFELFSWKIVVAGLSLPWIGYFLGYVLAKAFKQPNPDSLAIAIETGIENTGIAIFLLRFALEPLHADLTTVIPVAIAIMTPVPLTVLYFYKKIKERFCISYRKSEVNRLYQAEGSGNGCTYRMGQGKHDSAVACLS